MQQTRPANAALGMAENVQMHRTIWNRQFPAVARSFAPSVVANVAIQSQSRVMDVLRESPHCAEEKLEQEILKIDLLLAELQQRSADALRGPAPLWPGPPRFKR